MAKWRNTTQKPPLGARIDWSNPITKDLVGCWLFNEYGTSYVSNLVTNKTYPFVGALDWEDGGVLKDSATGKYIDLGYTKTDNLIDGQVNDGWTIYFIATTFTGSAHDSERNLYEIRGGDGGDTGAFSLSIGEWGGADDSKVVLYTNNNGWYDVSSNGEFGFNSPNDATLVCYPDSTLDIWINKNKDVSGGSYTAPNNSYSKPRGFFESSAFNYYSYRGILFYFLMFNRPLADDEIKLLHYEPYSFFEVPSMRTVVAFSGGPITASPDETYHEHYAESPTVAVTVIVSPAETYHEHYADNITATTSGTVTVDETYHEHYADVVSAQRVTTASADETYHEHYADNVTASVGGAVDPQETYHEHYADEVQATVTVNAPVDETYHLHVTDSVYVPDSGYRKKLIFNPFTGTFDYIAIPG